MTWLGKNWFRITVILLLLVSVVRAQTGSPFYFQGSGTVATCPAPIAGVTAYCYPTDGPAVSLAGAGWKLIPLSAAGVSSFNGRTGPVISAASDYSFSQISGVATAAQVPAPPTPPVLSVNGKVGAVTLTVQ
jgi:hypothetical protein